MAKRGGKRTDTPAALQQPADASDKGDQQQVAFVRVHKHDGVTYPIGGRAWLPRASVQLLEDIGAAYACRSSS